MQNFKNFLQSSSFKVLKKLTLVSVLISVLATFLAITLKKITEHYEEIFASRAFNFPLYYFLFPLAGLTIIYFLRKYLFKNKENKGIKEVFDCTNNVSKNLPLYKIPSHFINGFFTVIFGGATGIEVSTVVASATIGSIAHKKESLVAQYKTELICAGIAAGITALFGSPIAGILFSLEVISRKVNKSLLFTNGISVITAAFIVYLLDEPSLFSLQILNWNWFAVPYFVLLGILAGINSVFLTKCVLFCKSFFSKIERNYTKILIAAVLIGGTLFLFPELYGDGYHGIQDIVQHPNSSFSMSFLFSILGILLLKPIITAVTLGAGGDGGVFAPSLVIGGFLGLFVATFLNTFFGTNVLPLNFIIIGMAALLSASIHAPFTSIFLVCGLVNDYTLFFPLLLVCLVSKYTAKSIYPYTVYSFAIRTV